jgi:hypothetical protein
MKLKFLRLFEFDQSVVPWKEALSVLLVAGIAAEFSILRLVLFFYIGSVACNTILN